MKNLPILYKGVLHENIRALIDYSANKYSSRDAFILKHKKGKEVSYDNMKNLPILYKGVLHENIRALIDYSANKYSSRDAFILKHKKGKEVSYEHVSYKKFREDIIHFSTYLNSQGYKENRIAIIGDNSYQWLIGYFATVCGLGVVVPLDKGLPYEEIITSLESSEATVLLYDKAHTKVIEKIKEANTTVTRFICMDDFSEMILEGKKEYENGNNYYYERQIDNEAMAIMLFTSGTTSKAKAVMISHKNITSNIYSVTSSIMMYPEDRNMAFLPFHHTFGSTGIMLMLHYGTCTAFCDGLKYLQKNLVEYKISAFICVPLLIEGIYKKVMATAKKQGKDKLISRMIKLTNLLLKVKIDIRRKVFKSVLEQLGGNIRLIVSGASAIDKDALAGFQAFGITTLQGYGLTETSPILTAECEGNLRLGSVGKPLVNIDIKIDNPNEEGIGEVLAKGPNVMQGYYNNPEETAKVFKNGWFRTGDLGYIDDEGYLFLCGRAKNVIVLKNGKNVYPEEIETLIAALPYVEENMVFGTAKKHDPSDMTIAAKIVYNKEYVKNNYGNISEAELHKIIDKDIDEINKRLPSYKQIIRTIVTDVPTIKTTTAKIKRHEEIKKIDL